MDPRQRLQRGQNAAVAGRYEDALSDYIWFHEHALEHRPSLYGVRLSFALSYWMELAKDYPPAKTALERIRDEKTKRLLNGAADRDLFHDVESINEHLGADQATYELFAALEKTNAEFASLCTDIAMPSIVRAKDFKMARRYTPSPADELRRYSDLLNQDVDDLKRRPASKAPRLQAYVQIYVQRVRLLTTILRGTNEIEEANALQLRALEFIKSAPVRKRVNKALQSAA